MLQLVLTLLMNYMKKELQLGIGMKKGNTALLEAVNAAMTELKADGTFQAIVDRYITAD